MESRSTRRVWGTAILALWLMVPALAAGEKAPPRPSLTGTWRFNDDVTARLRAGQRQEKAPPGGMRPRGGGGGRGPGGGGRGPGGGGRSGGGPRGGGGEGRMVERPNFEALNVLTIVQAEVVTVTDGSGRRRVFQTDGRKVRDEEGPNGPAEVRARWGENGDLVVQIKPKEGPKRTETYTITNDGKRLFLTLELDGMREMKIVRAYDREVETAQPPASPSTEPPPATTPGSPPRAARR